MGREKEISTLLTLPTEVLVYIMSFVAPLLERMKLRYVSRKLQSACETPSLWRRFVWPYFHTGDESCVSKILKVCGQHVKTVSFPHHVMPTSQLLSMLATYCNNTVHLSLPTTKLDSELLRTIFEHMGHMQSLDFQWAYQDIKRLLKIVKHSSRNLKEITVREIWMTYDFFDRAVEPWLNYWTTNGFVPQRLNLAIKDIDNVVEELLLRECRKLISNTPSGHSGLIKFYNSLKTPMNLAHVLPVFQIELGQTATLPVVNADICGFSHTQFLILTDGTLRNQVVYKASLRQFRLPVQVNDRFTNFECIAEFDASYFDANSDHLERLAFACPNLQRLNLHRNKQCLKSLRGLCTIANSCHNLQGLNLMGISVTNVENQAQLWIVLGDMKLTHLAVDLCILLPSAEENKIELTNLFQKCVYLQALESFVTCDGCTSAFSCSSLSILSHFQALTHFNQFEAHNHFCATSLHDIVTSCNQLKYLVFYEYAVHRHCLTPTYSDSLEQLSIRSRDLDLPDDFMSSISAHGGLVHVELFVRSVTSEGIILLVTNSPNLLTFHAFLDDQPFESLDQNLKATLKEKMCNQLLFTCDGYLVEELLSVAGIEHIDKSLEDLVSFWK